MVVRESRAVNPLAYAVVLLLMLLIGVSCGGKSSPTAPDTGMTNPVVSTPNERNARTPENTGNRFSMGTYKMLLDIENQTIEVVGNRELAKHFDIRNILLNENFCPAKNCLMMQFLEIDEVNDLYTIKVTIYNPTYFNVFDVRIIIYYDEKAHRVLNPDDYTRLYEEGHYINPFRSFCKTTDNRTFTGYASFSEIVELSVPDAEKKWWIWFSIDASFPGNCEEPYEIENFGYWGDIYPDHPDVPDIDQGEGLIFAEVYDWQGNISEVTVDTTPITGGITELFYNLVTERYEATITNAMDAPPGEYTCLIAAYSVDDQTLGLYNYMTITVNETPPPTVQTIWGHIGDSMFLTGLDVSTISVVNQDPLGYPPGPVSVDNGDYVVDVATGIYNISVVPSDIIYSSVICYDILVLDDEDVHVDFAPHDPNQIDPYDPDGSTGPVNWWEVVEFAGRVVDTFGDPVVGATIEIRSPDSWGLEINQDFVQAVRTEEGGYFNLLNVPKTDDGFGDDTLFTYEMEVRAYGYLPTQLILTPLENVIRYRVIELIPSPLDIPIFEESFELTTSMDDWSAFGYYHRQFYDPLIINVAFDSGYLGFNMNVIPPDEPGPGSIPKPADGDYYIWYGVEQDGCFLGDWDPGMQTPYNGGMSLSPNSGTLTGPEIDLTGYSSARVEFDMCYSIETMDTPYYEMMFFYINADGFDNELVCYNPFTDPDTDEYIYTQKGFNRTLEWVFYQYDISNFTGGPIRLKWSFATMDSSYNAYRGQFIDNIKVYAN